MKNIGIVLLFLTFCGFGYAQNVVYDENAEIRSVPDFTGVEISGTISLYLSQGTSPGVAVSAGDAEYNRKIKTEVKNGILHVSVDGGMWNSFNWSNKKLKAYVTVVKLNKLESSGATNINMTDKIKTDELSIEISGASEIKGEVEATKLKIDINGASVAKLKGTVVDARLEASGASVINAFDLHTDICHANTSGASGIRIFVKDQLIADASGGSFIYYKGSPASTNLNSSGGSSIKNKNTSE